MNDTIEVNDTYEAAYYYISGAKLVDARSSIVPLQKRAKYLYGTRWYITLSGVPAYAMQLWRQGNAVVNVRQLAAVRKKIKRFIKQSI